MFRFSSDNARLYAARAVQARRNRVQTEREAEEDAAVEVAKLRLPTDTDPYVAARLVRVRAQLDCVDAMIAKERDPQKLDRLASASARLAEQERQLAGRPLPGSLKPKEQKRQARYWERAPGAVQDAPAQQQPDSGRRVNGSSAAGNW